MIYLPSHKMQPRNRQENVVTVLKIPSCIHKFKTFMPTVTTNMATSLNFSHEKLENFHFIHCACMGKSTQTENSNSSSRETEEEATFETFSEKLSCHQVQVVRVVKLVV